MGILGIILLVVGGIIGLAATIAILIKAFKTSILWGLGSLLVPFVILVYVAMHWEDTKKWFLYYVGGAVLAILGAGMGAMGAKDAVEQATAEMQSKVENEMGAMTPGDASTDDAVPPGMTPPPAGAEAAAGAPPTRTPPPMAAPGGDAMAGAADTLQDSANAMAENADQAGDAVAGAANEAMEAAGSAWDTTTDTAQTAYEARQDWGRDSPSEAAAEPSAYEPAGSMYIRPGSTYVIQRGDNLWDLSELAYGDPLKYTAIAEANGLNPYGAILVPGESLQIPAVP